MEHWWYDNDREKLKYSVKIYPNNNTHNKSDMDNSWEQILAPCGENQWITLWAKAFSNFDNSTPA